MLAEVKGSGGVSRMYSKHYTLVVHRWWAYRNSLGIFLLLLVYNAESEVDFVTFAMIGIDVEYVGECFFGVIEGSISII